jgi:hypothetical protein
LDEPSSATVFNTEASQGDDTEGDELELPTKVASVSRSLLNDAACSLDLAPIASTEIISTAFSDGYWSNREEVEGAPDCHAAARRALRAPKDVEDQSNEAWNDVAMPDTPPTEEALEALEVGEPLPVPLVVKPAAEPYAIVTEAKGRYCWEAPDPLAGLASGTSEPWASLTGRNTEAKGNRAKLLGRIADGGTNAELVLFTRNIGYLLRPESRA